MKKLLIFLLFLVAFGLFAFIVYQGPLLRIQTIHFNKGYDIMDEEVLEIYSGVRVGELYYNVDVEAAKEGLMAHPFVRNVEVRKEFPSLVEFDIEYRAHFITLSYLDILLSVDEDMVVLGVLTKKLDGYSIVGLPIDGYSAGRSLSAQKLYVLQNVINFIKLFELSGIQPNEEVVFNDNSILFEIDGIMVNFGLGENQEKRFNNFVAIYEDLKSKDVHSGVIDISSDGHPVYKPFD